MKTAIAIRALLRMSGGLFSCLLLAITSLHPTSAQQSSYGNLSVHSGAQIFLSGIHTFQNSRVGTQPGIIQTSRKGLLGVVGLKTAVTSPASDESHVDGYVSQSGTAVLLNFPVGDKGKLRPFFLQGQRAVPMTALGAYFAADPQIAQSDNMEGKADPTPLPAGAPFSRSALSDGLAAVSSSEYWDIDCASSAHLSLSWNENSNITTLSGGALSNLTIVGWHNGQNRWVAIPSSVDVTSKLGGSSSLASGSISTTAQILANDYAVFTIGRKLGNKVRLAVKVLLQGGIGLGAPVGTMRNNLQLYENDEGQISSLIPANAPYTAGAAYPGIGNPAGPAGEVVDWVKVEVREASGAQRVIESKSLLLKTDGNVVDVDGQAPLFEPQAGTVRLIIRHRNHLGVSSNNIASFAAGDVTYDFTDALTKAFEDQSGNPPLMKEVAPGSNLWCLWTADILNDATIDAPDVSIFRNAFLRSAFGEYVPSDVNLDGYVDAVDTSIMRVNFRASLFSNIPL